MSRRRNSGFTLVELLVVIGIIALLISILLPALSKAKRSANTVKCAASLKQIGNSFLLYQHENRQYWPTTRDLGDPNITNDPTHRWTDLIAKYMTKIDVSKISDIALIRRNSVIWGCPEWTKANDFTAATPADDAENVYTGYGMQYTPTYYEDFRGTRGSTASLVSRSHSYYSGATRWRGYVKAGDWQRKPSAMRPLIMDSRWDLVRIGDSDFIVTPGRGGTQTEFWPVNSVVLSTDPTVGPTHDSFESRHTKPGASRQTVLNSKGINVLYCDMHVDVASPFEVHTQIRKQGA